MTSAEFKPAFQENVIANGVGGAVGYVNPAYCATVQCALDLASVLPDLKPQIMQLPPNGPVFYGFVQAVPWFAFPDGSIANVGLLANYWMHGWPPEVAERNCRQDIATNSAYYLQMQGN